MKKLLEKNNKMKKLIALVLAFIMMTVPLYSYVDGKKEVKAEENITELLKYGPSFTPDKYIKTENEGTVTRKFDVTAPTTQTLYMVGNKLKINTSGLNEAVTLTENKTDSPETLSNITITYCYSKNNGSSYEALGDGTISVADDDVIKIYVKAEGKTEDDKCYAIEETEIASYTIKILSLEGAFYSNGAEITTDYTNVTAPTFKVDNLDSSSTLVGKIRMGTTSGTLSDAAPTISLSADNSECTVYWQYETTVVETSGNKTKLVGSEKRKTIKYDNEPPMINKVELLKKIDDTTYTVLESDFTSRNNVYYLDSNELGKFCIKATVIEAGEMASITVNDKAMTKDTTNVYYYNITADDATGLSLTLKASDAAGNNAQDVITNKVKAVDMNLKATVKVTSDVAGYTESPLETTSGSYTYTKAPLYINVSTTSGYYVNKMEVMLGTETVKKIEVAEGDSIFSGAIYSLNKQIAIPYDFGGKFQLNDIKIKVTDSNSRTETVPVGNAYYDNLPPTTGAVLQKKDATTGSWEPVTVNAAGAYLINTDDTTSASSYRYVFNVADDTTYNSDVKSCGLYSDAECTTIYNGASSITNGGTYVLSEIDFANINANDLQLYVKAEDNAGNSCKTALTKLIKVNTDLIIDKVEFSADGGVTKLPFSSISKKTNQPYKMYLTVSSGYKINTAKLTYKNGANQDKEIVASNLADKISSVEADAQKRYVYNLQFDIPVIDGTDYVNQIYNSMKLTVVDEKPATKTEDFEQLIYDFSLPVITFNPEATTDWVKTNSCNYKIEPGNQAPEESKIASASYEITGSKGNTSQTIGGTPATILSNNINVPESDNIDGTKIVFTATDEAGNPSTKEYKVKVDNTKPTIVQPTIGGQSTFAAPLTGAPTIQTSVKDNLTLAETKMVITYPDGTIKTVDNNYAVNDAACVNIEKQLSYQIEAVNGSVMDGTYAVVVTAVDKAGNDADSKSLSFVIDNTAPSISAAITSGTKGGKRPRPDGTDYYYSSNVSVGFTVNDANFDPSATVVKDNDKTVTANWTASSNGYTASITVGAEGAHRVTIDSKDKSGNPGNGKVVTFAIDKSTPEVSLTLNSLIYQNGAPTAYLTGDAVIGASVSDMTEDVNDFNVQIIQKKPDQPQNTPNYLPTANRSFNFSEEADYTFNCYAIDMAGNRSVTKTVDFRVDKTAPELTIGGIAGGGTSANSATISLSMKEAFWWDATGTATIYRKAGDGKEETLLKTIDFKPTAFNTTMSETLSDTGVYRIEFTATDKVGHKTETSQTFTIDREAPVVTLTGVNNYDKTDKSVSFYAEITDDFYASKKVAVSGTKTDIDGKVVNVEFAGYNPSSNPTAISKEFTDDGIYDITVSSTDAAGNSHESKVHFIIDKTAPKIGDLSDYDGTILKEFKWNKDLNDLVTDLTVCDTHMFLNGSEYDGVSEIEDGSYTLLITAEDELGHKTEKSVAFVLDTKAPVFIVTGVEDGEVKKEQYTINVSLQLAEDTLSKVTLNGKEIEIKDNTADIIVNEKGEYTLTMNAEDEAGNKAENTISFTYGEEKAVKSNWWKWIIIGVCAAAVIAGIIIAIKKNEKDQ